MGLADERRAGWLPSWSGLALWTIAKSLSQW